MWPEVPQSPDLPALESAIIDFWEADDTFRASVEARPPGRGEYVFYDGPPYANGLPHYGSLITGFVKDAIPRYQTMRGRRVERRFGWDCHGLPVEMATERELGVSGRAAITAHGIAAFNAHCRSLVQRTTAQWRHYVSRQARWVDFDDDYKTMDLTYMESVMWAFKGAYDKGLAYRGYRVLPYCWECQTPLSNFETRQDDSYRPRIDPAVTVSFELDPAPLDVIDSLPPALRGHLRLLVWTTTPWTLPSNLALAVGPDIDYSVYDTAPHPTVVATALAEHYAQLLPDAPVAIVKGAALVGRSYRPLFHFFADVPGAFVVLGADFVTTEEGTGVVHLAPGFGEDDQRACEGAGIAVVCPVDEAGRFTAEVPPYAGTQVFDANHLVIADLAATGALVAKEAYSHSYPHCWRTDTPLIYKAVTSWFVQVTAIRDRMVELNKTITWIPEHVRDGAFGKWLEGARDWSITRNRFWGTPIPVWVSDDPRWPRVDVYGSLDELEADFGERPKDLHRPFIDELVRPNPDDPSGEAMMRRVPDVLDVWFDSGSMPFAQLHYPFEQRARFEEHFPADFIVEYVGQTRGWFYTLHVLSTLLFDCPPFTTCMAHGIVLGDDGRKMSKHLGNFPDIDDVFNVEGADAMRWALLSSSLLRGGDLMVERPMFGAAIKEAILPLWSTWHFLALYGNVDRIRGALRVDASGLLDRYILAKAAGLVASVTQSLDAYDPAGAAGAIASFLDALTNWYVRRSRERFWRPTSAGDTDKSDAYDTLTTVLEVLCRVAAPLLPLVSEAIWKGLTGGRSVHLTDWPDASALPANSELVGDMDRVREICSAAHSIRKAAHRRTRLPLATLTVAAPWASRLAPFANLIAEESNVKAVALTDEVAELAELVLVVRPGAVGPRLGPATQGLIAAAKRGEWEVGEDGSAVVAGRWALSPGEFVLDLRPRDSTACRALPDNDAVVSLDLEVTAELEAEGTARDVVRKVSEARRAADLNVADRIDVVLETPGGPDSALGRAVLAHREWVMSQTLALSLAVVAADERPAWSEAGGTGPGGTGPGGMVVHLRKAPGP
ncbi:MAG: isoleucine--tRNA ligase [Acidimicrobiales bacterium]